MYTRVVVAAAILIGLLIPVHAQASDVESDEKKVSKIAVPAGLLIPRPKGLCVCLDDATADSIDGLGILAFERVPATLGEKIEVLCRVYQYDSTTGNRVAFDQCETWVPLAK